MAQNLIPNGGFEEEADEKTPAGWSNAIDGRRNLPGMYVREGEPGGETHSGSHALKLHVNAVNIFAGTGRKPRNIWESILSAGDQGEPSIKIEPGKTYRWTFWVKLQSVDDPTHSFGAECRGMPVPRGDEYKTLATSEKLRGTLDWQKQEIEFTVPPDSNLTELQVTFRMLFADALAEGAPEPIALVDDVELVAVD